MTRTTLRKIGMSQEQKKTEACSLKEAWRRRVTYDATSRGGTNGGYFEKGRNGDVLEGNTKTFTSVSIIDALERELLSSSRRIHARDKWGGTMSVSIGDKIEVSTFAKLTGLTTLGTL